MSFRIDPTAAAARNVLRGAVAVCLTLGALTACGSDEPDTGASATSPDAATTATAAPGSAPGTGSPPAADTPSEAESITVTEVDFSISVDEDSLAAGTYEIEVVNEGDATHDLVIERDGEDVAASDPIEPGQSTTLTVTLEPGQYVFYCSIGNHRAMGMELPVEVT